MCEFFPQFSFFFPFNFSVSLSIFSPFSFFFLFCYFNSQTFFFSILFSSDLSLFLSCFSILFHSFLIFFSHLSRVFSFFFFFFSCFLFLLFLFCFSFRRGLSYTLKRERTWTNTDQVHIKKRINHEKLHHLKQLFAFRATRLQRMFHDENGYPRRPRARCLYSRETTFLVSA